MSIVCYSDWCFECRRAEIWCCQIGMLYKSSYTESPCLTVEYIYILMYGLFSCKNVVSIVFVLFSQIWRPVCNHFDGMVKDFNFGTLLR